MGVLGPAKWRSRDAFCWVRRGRQMHLVLYTVVVDISGSYGSSVDFPQCGLHKRTDQDYRVTFGRDMWPCHWLLLATGQGPRQRNSQTGKKQSPSYSSDPTFLSLFSRPSPELHHLHLATVPADLLVGLRETLLACWRSTCSSADDPFFLGQVPLPVACSWPPALWFHWDFPTLDSCDTASPCHSTPRWASRFHPIYSLMCPSDLVSHLLAWQPQ